MSYRLIDSNAIAIKYPEVNEMPCVFANLPDGMNGQFIDVRPEVLACGNGELVAKLEPQWIPVSERLPEDLSEVNVTWVNHNPEPYYEFTKDKPFTAAAVYYKGKWYWYSANCVDNLAEYGRCDWDEVSDVIEIVAWMPLPEPYRPNK